MCVLLYPLEKGAQTDHDCAPSVRGASNCDQRKYSISGTLSVFLHGERNLTTKHALQITGPVLTDSQIQEAYMAKLFAAAKADGDEEEVIRSKNAPVDDDW